MSHYFMTYLCIGLGKVETVTGKSGKMVWKDMVPWKDTRCSNIPGTAPHEPYADYHQGKSIMTSTQENRCLDGDVIVQQPADGKESRLLGLSRHLVTDEMFSDVYWADLGNSGIIQRPSNSRTCRSTVLFLHRDITIISSSSMSESH
jgi:hypothetical protein